MDPNIEYDLRSMAAWFELIEEAMAFPAAKLVVNYDKSLGYPTSIYIDYHARMADDEVTISEMSLVKIDKF